jgi:PPK2 family polyphosphate:nucleotide phosphotransferase
MEPFAYTLEPGQPVQLSEYETRYRGELSRKQGEKLFEEYAKELDDLQEMLYATGTHSLLVVLQGMDTSGKDGTIRNVFQYVSTIGCRVQSFKVPTEEELAHDFLWRVHRATPARGNIAVFNRSHYEDVLVVRVRNLAPEAVWQKRYQQINDFERLLVENNTIVLKFFLHISKDEQKERLLERQEKVVKAWKLAVSDWEERQWWDDYQRAYEEALAHCTTPAAPWIIVPADRKWFRNLAVAQAIVEALRPYQQEWMATLEQMSKTALAALHALPEELKR